MSDKFGKYAVDSDENSDYMYNIIADIIEECGPRAAGSEGERKAAEWVAEELKKSCDSVEIEEFKMYPKAFMGWVKLDIGLLFFSFLMLILHKIISMYLPIDSVLISIFCLAIGLFCLYIGYKQFLKYEEWTPKIFPYKQVTSQNTVGILRSSSGEAKKRVVLAAHIDSTRRWNLNQYLYHGYFFFVFGIVAPALLAFNILYLLQLVFSIIELFITIDVGIIVVFLTWVLILIPFIAAFILLVLGKNEKFLFGGLSYIEPMAYISIIAYLIYALIINISFFDYVFTSPSIFKTLVYYMICIFPVLIIVFFWVSNNKATPGAIDNLSAVAPPMCVAKILKEWKDNYPDLYPKETEVVIAIVGCEEVGLRGSEAFARKHAEEYNKIDTTSINYESLSISKYQRIFTREDTTSTDLSPEVYNLLYECSTELGIETVLGKMPIVSGGTDAAGLVKGGLKAASIEGIDYKYFGSYYHTDRDNIDMVNKERKPKDFHGTSWNDKNVRLAMENALRTTLYYIQKKDQQ